MTLVGLLLACATPEAPAVAGPSVTRLVGVLDSDGDGRLSAAELARSAHPGLAWQRFDAGHDDALSAEEVAVLLREVSPMPSDHPGAAPGGTRPAPEGAR